MSRTRKPKPTSDPLGPLDAFRDDLAGLRAALRNAYGESLRAGAGRSGRFTRVVRQARRLRRDLAQRRATAQASRSASFTTLEPLLESLLHRLDLATQEDVRRIERRLDRIEERLAQNSSGGQPRRARKQGGS